MIFILDNYDSFTYNLVQYIGSIYPDLMVKRNDVISVAEVEALRPKAIVISPGPKAPMDAGISVPLIQYFAGKIPILGVCLGHQAMGEAFGGKVVRAGEIMHGKTSQVYHDNSGILKGLSNPFIATRYHSLIVDRQSLPENFHVMAETENKMIMAMSMKDKKNIYGVQFHPESILTAEGMQIIKNFIEIVKLST